jgi:predicted TIM-barrel fold metal-dependent hydrolase
MRQLIPLAFVLASATASAEPLPPPVIDMHLHAYKVGDMAGVPSCPGSRRSYYLPIDPSKPMDFSKLIACAVPFRAPTTDDALMRDTIAMLKKYNVRHAVASGVLPDVAKWQAAAPERIIPAIAFADTDTSTLPVEEYRRLHHSGAFAVFAELENEYLGIAPNDPRWEPYFAMAEDLDIPVGIHMGEGPVNSAHFPGYEAYRVRFTSPLLLEDVLIRHPKLRIYAMHYGSPMVEQTIAMMFTYPNLYVDVACNDWLMPRAQFYSQLKQMVDAGFEKRIMFGSDQMWWPQAIGESIHSIEQAPFLSKSQKRDILYNNAARFLRLSPGQISADHGRRPAAA